MSGGVLPMIEGYEVERGRRLIHARFIGRPSTALRLGRPWHVVAATAEELIDAVAPRRTPITWRKGSR